MRALRHWPLALLLAACNSAENSATQDSDSIRVARTITRLRPSVEVLTRPVVHLALEERMEYHKVPGVSLAVISGGKIVWAGGFGVKEAGTNDSVSVTTLFQAASISKPVAATAMLRLVAEGKVALDTNVNSYLKSWKVPDNRFTTTEKVTLRRLASHSAGLTVHGFPGYEAGQPVPTVVQVLDGAKPANTAAVRVDTTPGAIWRYAGGGTTVEQLLMTEVTGEPFPALMKRLVLDPVGMSSSTYEQPLPESRAADAARAYRGDGSMVKGRWHTYLEMAAAGLWTTPTDLAKWALAIAAARAGTDTTLLPRAVAEEMLTVQKGSWGIGPSLNGSGRAFRFGHGGANEGYRAELLYYPEEGVGAAVMTNSDRGSALIQELLYALSAEYGWLDYAPKRINEVERDSAALEPYVGNYVLSLNGQKLPFAVEFVAGKLHYRVAGESESSELIPADSAGGFHALNNGWKIEFSGDSVMVRPNESMVIPGVKAR